MNATSVRTERTVPMTPNVKCQLSAIFDSGVDMLLYALMITTLRNKMITNATPIVLGHVLTSVALALYVDLAFSIVSLL